MGAENSTMKQVWAETEGFIMTLDVSKCSSPFLSILLSSVQITKQILNNPLFNQMAGIIVAKLSTSTLFQEFLKNQFPYYLFQGFMMLSIMRKGSWYSTLKAQNIPWASVAFISTMIMNRMKDKKTPSVQNALQTFDRTKINQKNHTGTFITLGLALVLFIGTSYAQGVKNLFSLFSCCLNFKEEKNACDYALTSEEIEMSYNIKETEDYVLVEEKIHKESVDKSGVVVVDWQ